MIKVTFLALALLLQSAISPGRGGRVSPPPVPGPAFVQQCNSYGNYIGTTRSCTLSGVAAGDTLVIGINSDATTVSNVTATTGTPTSVVHVNDNYGYILQNSAAGSQTISVTFPADGKLYLSVAEYSNTAAASLDTSGMLSCTVSCSPTVNSSDFTTTAGSDLVWSMCSNSGAVTTAGTTPVAFTARTGPVGGPQVILIEDGVTGSAGIYHGSCHPDVATDIITIALKHP